MAGAPPVGRRARTTRTKPSNYVRTTLLFGALSSSRLLVASVPPASCVTWTTPQRNCPNPIHQEHSPRLGFGSHQFPASWSHGPLRSGTAQAPTHQTCSLRAQPACCTAHFRELPAQAPRSPVDLCFFLRFKAEAYARRATDKHTGINSSKDQRRRLRLLRARRPAYTFADGGRLNPAGPPWTTGTVL